MKKSFREVVFCWRSKKYLEMGIYLHALEGVASSAIAVKVQDRLIQAGVGICVVGMR